MEKYVEVGKKRGDIEKINAWYQQCSRRQSPYITVTLKGKYADVHWDYINYDKAVDDYLDSNETLIKEHAVEILKRHSNPKSRFSVSPTVINFENLAHEEARLAADDLYDFVADLLSAEMLKNSQLKAKEKLS